MATIRAPYADQLDDLESQSVYTAAIDEEHLDFWNRAGTLVAHLKVKNPATAFVKAVRRMGSFDTDYRDVLIKDWYHLRLSNSKLANPATLPTGTGFNLAWSPDGKYVVVGHGNTPYFTVYKRDGDILTKLANPANLPTASVQSVAWSPDGKYFIVTGVNGSAILYQRTGDTIARVGGGFNVFTPDTITSAATTVLWSPDGMYVVFLTLAPQYVQIYKRNSETATLFTKLPSVADQPSISGSGINAGSFSASSTYVAFASNSPPYLWIHKRVGDVFTKLPDPVNPPVSIATCVAWSLDGMYVAVGISAPPYFLVYKRNGDSFSRLTPPTGVSTQVQAIAWSPDGRYLAISQSGAPYLATYQLRDDLLYRLPDLSSSPGSMPYDLEFSPDGKYLAVSSTTTPYITVYKSAQGPISGAAIRIDSDAIVPG